MEKIICPACGASLNPNTTQAFLTCEYCDTAVSNPYCSQTGTEAAAVQSADEICVKALIEMGQSEKLSSLGETCFGNPLSIGTQTREELGIPFNEPVYLFYDRNSILGAFKEGFALAQTGLYYKHEGETGRRSWEAFVTGEVSCVDRSSWKEDGTLTIGSTLTLDVCSETDSRLARFLVDFHNHVYHQYTGETAPASWTVREAAQETYSAAQEEEPSLLDNVASAAKTLLGGATLMGGASILGHSLQRKTVKKTPVIQPFSRKTVTAKPRIRQAEPTRPVDDRPGRMAPGRQTSPIQPGRSINAARPGGSRPSGGPGGRNPGGRGPGGMGGRGPGGPGGRGRR